LVDAITAPGATKPSGISYRLVAKRSVVSQAQAQVPIVKACVDAALTGTGIYEAPPGMAPEIFVEVSYGRDGASQVDPASRETYLELSGRSNPEKSVDKATGPELWNVRVAILGVSGTIESALPLLASVAVGYIATDTHNEAKLEIPQNSPVVESVRLAAIKNLQTPLAPPTTSTPESSGSVARSASGPSAATTSQPSPTRGTESREAPKTPAASTLPPPAP
jgi:hypothetical protein